MAYEKHPNQNGQNWPVSTQYQTHPSSSVGVPVSPQYDTFPQGITAESLLAESTWQLWGDDALDTAGTLTSWPADAGPSPIPATAEGFTAPSVVTVAARNNRKAVVFVKAGDTALDVNGDVNTVAGDHTLLMFLDPDVPSRESSTAQRDYVISSDYNAAGGRLIFAHLANDGRVVNAYRHPGFYNAAADGDSSGFWHNYQRADNGNPYVMGLAGPQCRVDVLESGALGVSKFFRDGVLIGTNPGHYLTTRTFAKGTGKHRIGTETTAVPGATNVTDYAGKIFCVLYWPRALTTEEVQTISAYVMTYYNWTARAHTLPNERAGCTGWYSSSKNITAGSKIPTTAPAWPDLMAKLSLLSGSLTVTGGVADFVPNNDLSRGSAMSEWVTADAYSVYCVAFVRAISTSSATTNLNDALICDSAGRWGLHLRDAGSGNYEARGYHTQVTGGTPKWASVTVPSASIINKWVLFIWRYDGATDTMYLQLDSGSVASTTGVEGINNLTGTLAFGGRPADVTVQYDGLVRECAVSNVFHDNTAVAQMRVFFEAMRDAA